MEGFLIIILAGYAMGVTLLAMRLHVKYHFANVAIDSYKRMIEETRQGKPPFLLNPGFKIVKED